MDNRADRVEAGMQRTEPALLEESLTLRETLALLLRNKRLIALATVMCLALGTILVSFMRPSFTASAMILPPQQQQSSANALMGQLGNLLCSASGGGG